MQNTYKTDRTVIFVSLGKQITGNYMKEGKTPTLKITTTYGIKHR